MKKGPRLVAQILCELTEQEQRHKEDPSKPFGEHLWGWIGAGNGLSLPLSLSARERISNLARHLYTNESPSVESINRKDWDSLVLRVVGPILGESDLDDRSSGVVETIYDRILQALREIEWSSNERLVVFGCSLLDHGNEACFAIGPVRIIERQAWLKQALARGYLSSISARRIRKIWSGGDVRPRIESKDYRSEKDIVAAVGPAKFVCTVRIRQQFGEFGKERALLAAKLALLGVALLWHSPRRALENLHLVFDGPPFLQSFVMLTEQGSTSRGMAWKNVQHGISLFGDAWEPITTERQVWWDTISDAIDYLVGQKDKPSRPRLSERFANALIWMERACRDPSPMFATAAYISCLDSLAGGKRLNGIFALVEGRLGIDLESPIVEHGSSYRETIKRLYNRRRSRLLHGNSEQLLLDWSDDMAIAEQLCRLSLISCFEWVAQNPDDDDPELLIRQ